MTALRATGKRVGVLAVDPSSPFSGGALLGDRVRMQDHALDRDVYIRSMASRGHLGGLAWTTPQALRVLDAAGLRRGARRDRRRRAERGRDRRPRRHHAGAARARAWATAIQAAKAGILEIGDVYVVNKADRDGADQVRRDLRTHARARPSGADGRLEAADRARPSRRPARASTRWSTRSTQHRAWLRDLGRARAPPAYAGPATRSRRSPSPRCARGGATCTSAPSSTTLAEQVVAGHSDPYAAADVLLETYTDLPASRRPPAGHELAAGPRCGRGGPSVRRSSFIPASCRCRRPPVSGRAPRCSSAPERRPVGVVVLLDDLEGPPASGITLRPTSSRSSRSATLGVAGVAEQPAGLAELEVGGAGELVEGVEVPAGPLDRLQGLAELADRGDDRRLSGRSSRVLVAHASLRTPARLHHLATGALLGMVRVMSCKGRSEGT